MKYFFIEGKFSNPIPIEGVKLDNAIKKHMKFLKTAIDEEIFLFTGPKQLNDGVLIIAKAKSLEEIESYLEKDALKQEKVQEYKICEFKHQFSQEYLSQWFS